MLLWSSLCSFADAKRQMADWLAPRVRDWDRALMRHEGELAKKKAPSYVHRDTGLTTRKATVTSVFTTTTTTVTIADNLV